MDGKVGRRPAVSPDESQHCRDEGVWAVAWNVTSAYLLIQQPPGAMNWCIGCTGRSPTILWHGNPIAIPPIPSETWELPGTKVQPASLYLEQLRERLGAAEVKNLGY